MSFARHAVDFLTAEAENAPEEALDHSRPGILLAQRDDGPAALAGSRGERFVGIDGNRPRDALEQWQIIVRVAVKHAFLELGEAIEDLREFDPREVVDALFAEGAEERETASGTYAA